MALICSKYKLFSQEISNWLGHSSKGIYFHAEFSKYYKEYLCRRRDFLDEFVFEGKLSKAVWQCLVWSQLREKVQPPKEVISNADIHTTMQLEDMHEMIARLKKTYKAKSEF